MERTTKEIILKRLGISLIVAVVVSSFLLGPEQLTESDTEKAIDNAQILVPIVELPDPCGLAVVECPGEEEATKREVTAYTSEINQTDGSPCISANGTNICEMWQEGQNVCAANFVPFGTQLQVGELGTCTVVDRMNPRYPQSVDWYFGYETSLAIRFGRKNLDVTILKN